MAKRSENETDCEKGNKLIFKLMIYEYTKIIIEFNLIQISASMGCLQVYSERVPQNVQWANQIIIIIVNIIF